MRLLIGLLTVSASLLVSLSTEAALPSPDSLTFEHWAREARGRKFISELEAGHAKINLAQKEYSYRINRRLFERETISPMDYSKAITDLLNAQFDLKRAEFHVVQAQLQERIWKMRAKWARGEEASANDLAAAYIQISEKRREVIKDLADKSKPYLKEINERYLAAQRLLERNAMSPEEFFVMKLQNDEAQGLQAAAEKELNDTETELGELKDSVKARAKE